MSNFTSFSCVFFLSSFKNNITIKIITNQNSVIINHKFNNNFNRHIILKKLKRDTKKTCSITDILTYIIILSRYYFVKIKSEIKTIFFFKK